MVGEAGELRRIVVAVDPPASARKTSDACGIVAAGLDADGNAVVLADATLEGGEAAGIGRGVAVALFHRLEADCIVAEVNQGGDMVTAVIRTVDRDRAGEGGAGRTGANGCAPSRWRRSTARAG